MAKRKNNGGELTLYIVYAVIALAGLTLAVLHIVGMNITNIENPLRVADETFTDKMKMSFLVFGSLLVVFAGVLSAITLAINGNRAELEEEKRARRRQRMALEDFSELE